MRRPLLLNFVATSALIAGVTSLSSAASADPTAPLSPVVVTAPPITPLDQTAGLDRTGAPLSDIPRTIDIAPRSLMDAQGATRLTDVTRDISGVAQGGQFAFGFFDRVIIRGLNASYLNDGLPDGASDLTGYTHSLVGVARIEVLKGPGSALFGSAEPGGSINIVHVRPSDVKSLVLSEQYGSFGTTTTTLSAGGPSGTASLDWRFDGGYQQSDGYRNQRSQTTDLLASAAYRPDRHDIETRIEYHHLDNRPDATGIPFSPPNGVGKPLAVDPGDTYYTPYADARQDITRGFISDAWKVSDRLTLNIEGGLSHRQVDVLRNAGGSVALVSGQYALTKRQLRRQSDAFDDANFRVEPNWNFTTGGMKHLLLTGLDLRRIDGITVRATADLANIGNIYAPVVTDAPLSGLTFKCDSAHNCDNARLKATFVGVYATDQIDVSDALKLRLSVRQDGFKTSGEARALLPANGGQQKPCTPPAAAACPWVPGQTISRDDALMSYDAGAVYKLSRGLSVFAGYSSTAYPIFNTEEPESVGQTPERGTQLETGLRFQSGDLLSLTTSLYDVTRQNVFTQLTQPNPAGPGNITVAQTFSYRVQGWESDVNLKPVKGWTVLGNLALQDGAITRYPQTPADLGRPIPSVPKVLANLWTSYDLARIHLSAGVRYRGTEFADAGQTRKVPGAALFDLGLNLPVGPSTLAFGVENLLDRRNFLYGDGTGGGALPGAGRTAFVKLSAKLW